MEWNVETEATAKKQKPNLSRRKNNNKQHMSEREKFLMAQKRLSQDTAQIYRNKTGPGRRNPRWSIRRIMLIVI